MRVKKKGEKITESDLTPMIDMVFQLIAFFMVLINFSQSEQNERIKLPESELAKPAESPLETSIVIHLVDDGTAIIGGREVTVAGLAPLLRSEVNAITYAGKSVGDATIVIRAHRDAATGKVQELIKKCQEEKFEKFALRAKEHVGF